MAESARNPGALASAATMAKNASAKTRMTITIPRAASPTGGGGSGPVAMTGPPGRRGLTTEARPGRGMSHLDALPPPPGEAQQQEQPADEDVDRHRHPRPQEPHLHLRPGQPV